MKTLALTTALVASILVNAVAAQAAPRQPAIDGYKLFQDITSRDGH